MTTTQSAPAGAETTKRVTLDPVGVEFKMLADYLQQRALIRASEVGELAARVTQLTELLEAKHATAPTTAAKPTKD